MPIAVDVKPAEPETLRYGDLKPGDVFTWGNGTYWYLKTKGGYIGLHEEPSHITNENVRTFGSFEGVQDLRLAKKATLLIEE